MNTVSSIHFPQFNPRLLPLKFVCVLALGLATARADWPNTNATKWVQLPNPTISGYDVLAAQPPPTGTAASQPIILADDFQCTTPGPVTDIHVWASWLFDTNFNPNIPITLAIWSDVPATNGPTGAPSPSHPGTMLWSQTFAPGQYKVRAWGSADPHEWFWSPDPPVPGTMLGSDRLIFQYNFYPDPANTFSQKGTAARPVTYWLSMTAGANVVPFGWKTSITNWSDNAVFGHLDAKGTPLGDWEELMAPQSTAARSLDLAFAITTVPQPPPPPPPAQTNKWIQYPALFGGFDISATMPNIVADDFRCTNASTLTNIQIWASWMNNQLATNATFTLSIWSDMPLGATAPVGSRPARMLWSETFAPGTYTNRFYSEGQEQFYDPTTGQMQPESAVWLYSFTPVRPFCQRGSANNPVTYWLAVSAQVISPAGTPPANFGWKTSTNHWGDNAVFGHLTAAGSALNDWHELINPTTGQSLDLAFLLNNGPPNADCEPARTPKYVQLPDRTTNGRDVLATAPEILADDFPCRLSGPISGVTVWGSWNKDQVDTNVVFQLSLWSDVPKSVTNGAVVPSHPGSLLCTTLFYPPQAVGTSLARYNYHLYAGNLQELFYNPDLSGGSGFVGSDSQIWQYDFYPFSPSCWRQAGSPFRARTYWLAVSALETNANYSFGWKTTPTQWGDDAVFGHVDTKLNPLRDWKELIDPRTEKSLNLAFALRQFPVVGINKDFVNTTGKNVDGVQIVLSGVHQIIWHYDGTPPWPNFQSSIIGGNTVLTWSGQTLPPGTTNHVGFEMAAASPVPPTPPILSWNWLSAGALLPALQVNYHLIGGIRPILVLENTIVAIPVCVKSATVEFYNAPVPLDQLTRTGTRSPLASMPLELANPSLPVGGAMVLMLPAVQHNYMYAVLVLDLGSCPGIAGSSASNGSGSPTLGDDTLDFIQLPLDTALAPIIQSINSAGGNVAIDWSSVEGRTYQLQSSPSLTNPQWTDLSNGGVQALGTDTSLAVPVGGDAVFYRVFLVPQ